MVILGGMGNVWGVALGGIVLAYVNYQGLFAAGAHVQLVAGTDIDVSKYSLLHLRVADRDVMLFRPRASAERAPAAGEFHEEERARGTSARPRPSDARRRLAPRGAAAAQEFGGLVAVNDVDFAVPRGSIVEPDRAERRGQDDVLQHAHGRLHADRGRIISTARTSPACRRTRSPRSASPAPSRTSACSRNMSALENVLVGMHCRLQRRHLSAASCAPRPAAARSGGAREGARRCCASSAWPKGVDDELRAQPALRRPAPARDRARAGDASRSCCCWTSRPPA